MRRRKSRSRGARSRETGLEHRAFVDALASMELPKLDPIEARVLGSLIEKELTTPAYYPLSLNALVNACNQSNNRDPVMALGEPEVNRALDLLRDKKLAVVISGGENKVLKFKHRATETLELTGPEIALLCVLLLRGPQTPGELRGRTERMHGFADPADVVATLGQMAGRPAPLVALQPRQPGLKEARYVELLSGTVDSKPAESAPVVKILSSDTQRMQQLEADNQALRDDLAKLRADFEAFRKKFE
jgi:uncharacterized protein YceH (UPF0502 family)